jgi:AAA15 family ATPase/GTPase
MLIRFNVRNYLSFSERDDGKTEEFSMIAGKVRNKSEHLYNDGKIKLLKFAAVYGANASGKSNLVKALNFMRTVIVKGLPDGHTDQYCKIDPQNKNKASYFELEILLGGKYYTYGFEIILSQSRFISEWLIELRPDNSERVIFTRNIEQGEYDLGNELNAKGINEKIKVYISDVRNDSTVLFLPIMNQNKRNLYQDYPAASILRDVFDWIGSSLDINFPNQPISDYSYLANTNNIDEVCRIISAFGTGITNFEMVDVPLEKVAAPLPRNLQELIRNSIEQKQIELRNNSKLRSVGIVMRSNSDFFVIRINRNEDIRCQTIEFSHGKRETLFRLSEESDGTIRILDLLEILLAGENKTYVVDELDRCLHPSLTFKFVETFLQLAKDKNIQLIVTTHESRLMDFELLRRDEIWFVNKRTSGESDIYSLDEYNARFDQKIDKAYLEGRYGGVPVFSTVFPVKEAKT